MVDLTGIGRRVQAAIYADGVYGRGPVVPTTPTELERRALARMSRPGAAYIGLSAGQQRTAQANVDAFSRFRLVPRMLRDVAQRDLSTQVLGRQRPSPLVLSPIGVLEMAHAGADLAVARAASSTGVPMTISSQACHPTEHIARELGDGEAWFQLYWSADDDVTASFVARAGAAGCTAVVVTLDTHTLGWRTGDLDQGFLPFARGMGIAQYTSDPAFSRAVKQRAAGPRTGDGRRPTPAAVRSLVSIARHHPGATRENLRSPVPRAAVETFLDLFSRPSLTWDDLAQLRQMTSLPIVVKGLQSASDADRALDHGVDGIWVSNHGGRQVDGAVASLTALEAIARRVAGRVPIVFDSGVRSGSDVLVALALGADLVGLGRPYAYGLALAGERGAAAVVEHVLAEVDLTLGMLGCRTLSELDRGMLAD